MPKRIATNTENRTLAALSPLPLFAPGAPIDNMAPLKTQNHKPTSATILYQGLDTLVFSVYGELKEDVALCLEMAKEDAQAAPSGVAIAPLPAFDGVTPLMQASGAKYYEWRLVSQDLTVTIAKPSKSKRPKAQIRVSSECLWRLGGGGLVAGDLAEHYLRPLFEEEGYRVQLSMGHAATDYQGHDLVIEDYRGIVRRARKIGPYWDDDGGMQWWGSRAEMYSIAAGKSNAIRISLYDKTREIGKSGKGWFRDLWELVAGYQPGVRVWRLEYQWGREFLHERHIETWDDFKAAVPGLWRYSVGWFSFRTPNPDDTQASRWAVADWWAALSAWESSDQPPLPKVKQARPKFERMCDATFGYFTSLVALMGLKRPERDGGYADVLGERSPSGVTEEAMAKLLDVMHSRKGSVAMAAAFEAKWQRYKGFTMADA